jgi:hypothetical protein
MTIHINHRLGFGFDIEHNEDIIHRVVDEEGESFLVSYEGLLIKIPFFTIYIGDFYDHEEE